MRCATCKTELDENVGSISIDQAGNETTAAYFLCASCNTYMVEVYFDSFMGEGSSSVRGPVSRERGDAALAAIRACGSPNDKWCRCPTHTAFMERAPW